MMIWEIVEKVDQENEKYLLKKKGSFEFENW